MAAKQVILESIVNRVGRNTFSLVKQACPPALWTFIKYLVGWKEIPSYQGVFTGHNMSRMHVGRFAEINRRFYTLDPNHQENLTKLRHYLLCCFAHYAKDVDGDFVTAGISYGVAPRILYEFLEFDRLGKTFHMIDPFLGINATGDRVPLYNTDIEFVRKQYPKGSPIVFHYHLIPQCFPLPGLDRIAFVHLNTTSPEAEAASLRYLFDRLSPGGVIVIDHYSYGKGQNDIYDPAIESLPAEIFSMVTGQGVIIKSPKARLP